MPLFTTDDRIDLLDDNITSDDFLNFVRAVVKLQLHMVLSDPPLEMQLLTVAAALNCEPDLQKYEYWMFNKSDYYCIDGFPKEGNPCLVILPPPFRSGFVYQGIKPAVIVLSEAGEEVREHVRVKQELVLEKMRIQKSKGEKKVEKSVEKRRSSSRGVVVEINLPLPCYS